MRVLLSSALTEACRPKISQISFASPRPWRSRPPAKRSLLVRSCHASPTCGASLLEAAYRHSIGAFLAMHMCHSCKAALSQA